MERAARELSPNSTWILIQSESSLEAVGTVASFVCGSVGEGEFTIAADRAVLAPVMQQIVLRKLMHCLRVGDLPAFCRYLNLQKVHLRGLEVEPLAGLLPSASEGADDALLEFLHQNGFKPRREGQCRLATATLCCNRGEHESLKTTAGAEEPAHIKR